MIPWGRGSLNGAQRAFRPREARLTSALGNIHSFPKHTLPRQPVQRKGCDNEGAGSLTRLSLPSLPHPLILISKTGTVLELVKTLSN